MPETGLQHEKGAVTESSQAFRFGKSGRIQFLEFPVLKEHGFITHAFCTRWGGVSQPPFSNFNFSTDVGDREGNIIQNQEILSAAFDLPREGFLTVEQIHGNKIAVINGDIPGSQCYRGCDGIITNRPGLTLAVKTADCLPILLVDPQKHVIGAVHAGWRGTATRVALKAVDACVSQFASSPSDMMAFLGPSIGRCCYEVDAQVLEPMKTLKEGYSFFTATDQPERWFFDLVAANSVQLLTAGLLPENVVSARICTACNRDKFFSHRGDGGHTGRQINFLMMQ